LNRAQQTAARVAASIKEHTWHASQRFKDRAGGSAMMTLDVSDDFALRSWLLGVGRFVRVLAPSVLADWIQEELDQARQWCTGSDHALVADSDSSPGCHSCSISW
jgi:predicted DNA-binding transcriptional regulator YafY